MSTDKVSGDSRFDAGLRRLCEALSLREFDIDAGEYVPSEAHLAELRRWLLPLLGKAEYLSLLPKDRPQYWRRKSAWEVLRKELDTWRK